MKTLHDLLKYTELKEIARFTEVRNVYLRDLTVSELKEMARFMSYKTVSSFEEVCVLHELLIREDNEK